MMARERLSPALEAALAKLGRQVVTRAGRPADRQLVAATIAEIVHQARTDGLRAEQLVIAFRAVWNELPRDMSALPSTRDDVLVSALITAFYTDDRKSPDRRPQPRE